METSDNWLQRLADGDATAAQVLWEYFYARLLSYAEKCLQTLPPYVTESDDIVASVFKSLCRMAQQGAIPSVQDPEQLWPLLAVIAARKVKRRVRRARIGQPGREIKEADLARLGVDREEVGVLGELMGREPSPELMATMRDQLNELMQRLDANERIIAQLWLENSTIPAISSATAISQRTVARKLVKIRRQIRELDGENSADSAPETPV
jgi:RNA polymerase sigma factor (sigma-70 family)